MENILKTLQKHQKRKPLSTAQKELLRFLESSKQTSFDFFKIKRKILSASRFSDLNQQANYLEKVKKDIASGKIFYQNRKVLAEKLSIEYPDLPVSSRRDEIKKLIEKHQVVIVAGETGSGKTTQLGKICLELGRGVKGLIGHTQPRRIAARSVASRIANELNVELGNEVGYQVRFGDHFSENTLIKLMTDGILLNEISTDRFLNKYDTIIIDEAHERSLNNDFLIGYLKQILDKRPDLKVIITSATIDLQRFSKHFNNAPIIEISGRTFGVETRYRPLNESDDGDYTSAMVEAVYELKREGRGDILIFLSGEREIRDAAKELKQEEFRDTQILPLYARLNASEQQKIFKPDGVGARIILATNVAETSLTIPNIKYVIDTGFARISRYSPRTKVQRLPIEPISKASAEQRKGRCGRISKGICIRLYSEEDFNNRSDFTVPEILRTNLSSVILQMTALNFSDIDNFAFLEKPDLKQIKDGVKLLEDLKAIEYKKTKFGTIRTLSDIGYKLAKLPLDPRLGSMLLKGAELGALQEMLILVSFLSIVDPRERPNDKQQSSDDKHRRFFDKSSDFQTILNLFDYIKTKQKELTNNKFRNQCKNDYLNFVRVREWQDLHSQLKMLCRELKLHLNTESANYQQIHTALLAGFFAQIGEKEAEKPSYLGGRNSHFYLFPNSTLFKSQPKWIVSGEIVETSKLWARLNAKIEPDWVLDVANHLTKSNYSNPRYEKNSGIVVADEKVMLYGLTLIAQRKVNFGCIDPKTSREIFIQSALVEGNFQTRHSFFKQNQKLIKEVLDLEDKTRRRDILVDEQDLFNFYDSKIGDEVVSNTHFDTWYKKASKKDPNVLNFEKSFLIKDGAEKISALDFPNFWYQNDIKLKLFYDFDVGGERDGVTVQIPLALLNQIENKDFDWQIPGLREELAISFIKSLPKQLRRNFVPAPNFAKAFLERAEVFKKDFLTSFSDELRRMTGVSVKDEWDITKIPEHLKMRFNVIDDNGKSIAISQNLEDLKFKLKKQAVETLSQIADDSIEKTGIHTWQFGELPKVFEQKRNHFTVKGYPAIVDERKSVGVKLFDNPIDQKNAMHQGIRRLLWLNIPSPIHYLQQKLPNKAKLALYFAPFGDVKQMIDDCIFAAIDALIVDFKHDISNEEQFEQLKEFVSGELNEKTVKIALQVEQILTLAFAINKSLKGRVDFSLAFALSDIKEHLSSLVYPNFVTDFGEKRLDDIIRYLKSIEYRLEKLKVDPNSDRLKMHKIEQVQTTYKNFLQKLPKSKPLTDEILEIKFMIFELRVSLFAQPLGTKYPISDKRILNAIDVG